MSNFDVETLALAIATALKTVGATNGLRPDNGSGSAMLSGMAGAPTKQAESGSDSSGVAGEAAGKAGGAGDGGDGEEYVEVATGQESASSEACSWATAPEGGEEVDAVAGLGDVGVGSPGPGIGDGLGDKARRVSWADEMFAEEDTASVSAGSTDSGMTVGVALKSTPVKTGASYSDALKKREASGQSGADGSTPEVSGERIGQLRAAGYTEETSRTLARAAGKQPTMSGGFFKSIIRDPVVQDVVQLLATMARHKIPKSGHADVALATFTAATVPDSFVNGRARLRSLALVGDAALSTAFLTMMYRRGGSFEALNQFKANQLSDQRLKKLFAKSPLAQHVRVAGGVDLTVSKTSATAAEAFAGVLHLYCSSDAVISYALALGLTVA